MHFGTHRPYHPSVACHAWPFNNKDRYTIDIGYLIKCRQDKLKENVTGVYAMNIPVMKTKLHKPAFPSYAVRRTVLVDRLSEEPFGKLILVSAPAGFGKTTIVNEWLDERQLPFVWYTLDDWDNDLQQFFTYLATGLAAVDEGVSQGLLELLLSYQSIGCEAYIRALVTELHQTLLKFALVLDDYHFIKNEDIHHMMRLLLEHMPPHMILVVITREDPSFPFSNLRVKNRLIELKGADLRFGKNEVETYFERMSLPVSDKDVLELTKRTEGWIAGLQLAGISMKGQNDIINIIDGFSGNHQFVMAYLTEEVLNQQSQEVKVFLMNTSVLDSFCDELCDSLLFHEKGKSKRIIEYLLHANTFLVSMDHEGKWYRYHHLFQDLLQKQYAISVPEFWEERVHSLHASAARWYREQGDVQEAIRYYLKAENYEEAADIIESQWAEMDIQLQSYAWLNLAKMLPDETIGKRPVLSMGYGWALLDSGDIEHCAGYLDDAVKLYNRYREGCCSEGEIVISDWEQFELLPGTIATAYGYMAALTSDTENMFKYAYDALEKTPQELRRKRGLIEMLLAVAHWANGDLDQAEQVVKQAISDVEVDAIGLTVNAVTMVLGELKIHQGRLREAERIFERIIAKEEKEEKVPILSASLYLGLACIAFYKGDNKKSFYHMDKSKECGFSYSLVDWKYKYYIHLARLYCSEGLYDMALDCIMEGRASYVMNPIPEWISLDSMENLIRVKQGNEPILKHWVGNLSYGDQDDIHYLQVFDAMNHIRFSLTQPLGHRELEALSAVINRLSDAARRQNRKKNLMECLILQSLIAKIKGNVKACTLLLKDAMKIGMADNYIQPFLDETDILDDVYQTLLADGEVSSFVQKIAPGDHAIDAVIKQAANQSLAEPLTIRELEVLNLIVAGHSNQDICNSLFLALSTVKGYNQNIFGKLQVKRRTEAIARARELGLV